jgi:hypothetical protein
MPINSILRIAIPGLVLLGLAGWLIFFAKKKPASKKDASMRSLRFLCLLFTVINIVPLLGSADNYFSIAYITFTLNLIIPSFVNKVFLGKDAE